MKEAKSIIKENGGKLLKISEPIRIGGSDWHLESLDRWGQPILEKGIAINYVKFTDGELINLYNQINNHKFTILQ